MLCKLPSGTGIYLPGVVNAVPDLPGGLALKAYRGNIITTCCRKETVMTVTNNAVCCAGCGFDGGTHHHFVEVFNRAGEDSDVGTHVQIEDDRVAVGSDVATTAGNPSSRRNGVRIWLWCECCEAHTVIEIAQHKGATLLTTRKANGCPGKSPRDDA
jgi:hypothetical protein